MKLFNYNRIFKIFETYKVFFNNIFSLGLIQVANYLIPIITIPYLLRLIGIEQYGQLAFAASLITYLTIVVDFGFNISATKHVSVYRSDEIKLNEIFNSVYFIKLLLLLLSFVILLIIVFGFKKFSHEWKLYYISYLAVCGQFLFPVWFYQGVENLKLISIINLVTKLFFTISIFIFVKSPSDYLLVPFLTSFGYLIAGIFSIFQIKKKYKIVFKFQKISIIKYYFTESWYIFSSNFFISLYTSSNTFMLGMFGNNVILGQYVIVDRIIGVFKNLYMPISQSLFPLLSFKFNNSKKCGFTLLNKILKILTPIMLLLSLLIFFFSKSIIILISGQNSLETIRLLKIMSLLPFIITISNLAAIQGLYNLGKSAIVNKYIIIVSIIHITSLPYLIINCGNLGVAILVLLTETIVTILSLYFYKNEYKKNIIISY
jgi:PST family polysaccharide transporter